MSWLSSLRARFPGRLKRDEYYIRVCPYCGNTRWNCQVNVELLIFHCWAGGASGTVRGLFRDFNLPVDELPDTPPGRREYLPEEETPVQLPSEAKDILVGGDNFANWARMYLGMHRGVTEGDIISYKIMYASTGDFAGRVIVPLYELGELVYFVARAFMSGISPKYRYPERRRRNLLPMFRGKDGKALTLVILENAFSAIQIHKLGYSAVPLLGKTVTPVQVKRLREMNFSKYVVFLDADATVDSIDLAEIFSAEGLDAVYAKSPGPDPDELEAAELEELISNSSPPSVLAKVREVMRR